MTGRSDDFFIELQGLLDQLEVRRYRLGDLPDDVMYLLWGMLETIRDLTENMVVRIDQALDGKELRIGLAIPRPKTDLTLAEIVRDVEAGLAARKRVTRKEEEIVVVANGREFTLRVSHTPHEKPGIRSVVCSLVHACIAVVILANMMLVPRRRRCTCGSIGLQGGGRWMSKSSSRSSRSLQSVPG